MELRYALSLLGVVAVIAAAYYVTYLIAKRGNGKLGGGRMIRVRERFALSRDKMLCVAEFNGRLFFIAITNGGVEVIESIDAANLVQPESPTTPSFAEAFKKAWESRKGGRP